MHSKLINHLSSAASRRDVLKASLAFGGAAASTLLPGASQAGAHSSGSGIDYGDTGDNLYAFGKIWSSYDEVVIGAFHGLMYVRIPGKRMIPVFGYTGTGALQCKQDDDGSLWIKSRETGYFTDLETGEVLDTFVNPYNGKVCEVPEQRLGPFPVLMRPTGVVLPDIPMFGDVDLTTKVGPAIVNGDDVWIRDDASVDVDSDHPMMGKHTYNELVTYKGRLSEINDPEVSSATAHISFTSVTSWREWFQAEDVGGHTTARANGSKISRIEDFPPEYLAAARERHGEILADPDAALDAAPPLTLPEGV